MGLLAVLKHTIIDVKLADEKKYFAGQEKELISLKGMRINDIQRKGKFMIWEFIKSKEKKYALNHLAMTGFWALYSDDKFSEIESIEDEFKHYKIYFRLDNAHLIFINVRKFGKFRIMDLDEINQRPSIAKLGPDILEIPFNTDEFIKRLSKRKKEIGKALLDSSIIAGCGNIYKSEALFRAGINPFRACNSLKNREMKLLAEKLSEVALEALANKGSTLKDFKHVDGFSGLMQNRFRVYDRANDKCTSCDNLIIAEKQGDRTSFYCDSCQG